MNLKLLYLLALVVLNACGGSSGGGDDNLDTKVFEGQLTQGAAIAHTNRNVKHGENEPIENVKICAAGRCSTTDGQGNFGFSAPAEFKGGDVLFTMDGHGILAEKVVNIPTSAKNIFIHFESSNKSEVHLHHMEIDGVQVNLSHDEEHEGEHHSSDEI